MKTVLILATLFCLAFTTQFITTTDSKRVAGTVLNSDGQPIPAVDVFITGTKKGGQTDAEGFFEMMVPGSTETLTLKHYMYQDKIVTTQVEEMEIVMDAKEIATVSKNNKSEDKRMYFDLGRIGRKEGRSSSAPTSTPYMRDDAMIVEEVLSESVPLVDAELAFDEGSREKSKVTNERAGQLTAGEWNDLNNWEAWEKLVLEADYKEMQTYWGLDRQERVSVFVTNHYELPIPDCIVTLTSNGKSIWTTKTDNAGKAELWTPMDTQELNLEIQSSENRQIIKNVKRISEGVNRISFTEECAAPLKAEIMFVVDATGSMGDEIEFLKSELKDVIDQVEASRSSVDFKWGSVFYRDASDEYLTRQSPLTSKTKRVLDFIGAQSAGGGGDYPEAVNEGLEEALMQEWSLDAIARIVFLVLDAPPHHDPEVLKDLQSQIAFAAAMGIKIIPITASGINRQTEYLMKFMSLMTNGTYVFLTDHSGIGNGHLTPIVKDFEVEKLNNLLVRLISNYSDPGTCVQQEDNDPVFASVEVFPNPTVDMIQVKVPKGVKKVTLTTSSGMVIKSMNIEDECDVSFDLTSYVDGMYMVNVFADEKVYNYKVVKSNKA